MKQNLSYRESESLSKGHPKAVIEWPDGLAGPPTIFPLGESFEESEELRRRLEKLFRKQAHTGS
jgi:hypothetical protein